MNFFLNKARVREVGGPFWTKMTVVCGPVQRGHTFGSILFSNHSLSNDFLVICFGTLSLTVRYFFSKAKPYYPILIS